VSQLLTNTDDFDACDDIKFSFVANPCMLLQIFSSSKTDHKYQ